METKITKKKSKKQQDLSSVRLSTATKAKLEKVRILSACGPSKRKPRVDEVVKLALDQLTEKHFAELQSKTLNGDDIKEIMRQKYIAEVGPISKKEFADFQLTLEYAKFLNNYHLDKSA